MGRRSCLCLTMLMHLLPCGTVAKVNWMVMLLWTYIHKDMFGGGVVGLLERMGLRVNGWIRLHLRVQTIRISKFKFKNVLVKLICLISKYNF